MIFLLVFLMLFVLGTATLMGFEILYRRCEENEIQLTEIHRLVCELKKGNDDDSL